MLKTIKRYDMNDGVTIKNLKDAGFISIDPSKYSYYCPLHNEIELFVCFNINQDGSLVFDDTTTVQVLDDNFGQWYTPFYTSNKPFPFLNIVIFKYNTVMDSLVEKGILKPKVLTEGLEDSFKRTLKKD